MVGNRLVKTNVNILISWFGIMWAYTKIPKLQEGLYDWTLTRGEPIGDVGGVLESPMKICWEFVTLKNLKLLDVEREEDIDDDGNYYNDSQN